MPSQGQLKIRSHLGRRDQKLDRKKIQLERKNQNHQFRWAGIYGLGKVLPPQSFPRVTNQNFCNDLIRKGAMIKSPMYFVNKKRINNTEKNSKYLTFHSHY
jgi:hypothetical protein